MFSYFASLLELFNFQETILVGGVIVIYVLRFASFSHTNRGDQGLSSDPCSRGSG
jgi:hypothetical protein